jgi:hypothetical protein
MVTNFHHAAYLLHSSRRKLPVFAQEQMREAETSISGIDPDPFALKHSRPFTDAVLGGYLRLGIMPFHLPSTLALRMTYGLRASDA